MIEDRWTLRRYSKILAVGAALCWMLAELLERTNWQARQAADRSVHLHEMTEHQADEEADVGEEDDG